MPDFPPFEPPHPLRVAVKPKAVMRQKHRPISAPKSDAVARHSLKPVKVNPVIDEKPDAT